MNDYDQAARYSVKNGGPETRHWVFPKLPKTLLFSGWEDSQSAPRPGESDRRCDTIMKLSDDAGEHWAAIVELYTNPDPRALARGGEYLWRFWGELRHGPHDSDTYNMALALIFLTSAPGTTQASWTLPCTPPCTTGLGPRVLIMSNEDALAHIEMIAQNSLLVWLLIWLPLMKGGQTEAVAKRWRELAGNDHRLLDMADITLTFARLTDCYDTYLAQMKGITPMISPYAEEIRNDARIKLRRHDTLEILNERFPGQVPASIVKRINAETDLDKLGRWLKRSATASIEQFERDM